tara:strand:- start:610 stop:1113 length:504 start_codon:yes stop_codon:yes gene_type:complete
MKIYQDVLPNTVLEECCFELTTLTKQRCWGSSTLRWDPDIKKGVVGDSLHTYVPENTKKKIIKSISRYFPDGSKYDMQYFVWLQNAGISKHNDSAHAYGVTIYLNYDWDKNFGGVFLWDDGDPIVMKAVVPKRNMMIINDCNQEHMVTPVSPLTDHPRYTIQIWVDP